MFEKEAEEYTLKRLVNLEDFDSYQSAYDRFENGVQDAFQDGAEYGYNKANEWHKQDVDDIYDLISEDWSIKYFICIMTDKSRVTAIGNCDESCNGEVSVNLVFDHDDSKYYLDDIVWWKEIVLPELKETK